MDALSRLWQRVVDSVTEQPRPTGGMCEPEWHCFIAGVCVHCGHRLEPRATTEAVTFEWITPAGAWADFDRQARAMLNLTGEEFVARWDAGEYEHGDEDPDVTMVAMLRPSNGG